MVIFVIIIVIFIKFRRQINVLICQSWFCVKIIKMYRKYKKWFLRILLLFGGIVLGLLVGFLMQRPSANNGDGLSINKQWNIAKIQGVNDLTIARNLKKEVRILCWIMTGPKTHQSKAIHIKNTWGSRCNILLFMSSEEDKTLPTIALPVEDGRHNLWAKTKEAFKYIYKNHLDDADWFFKADDDTYAIIENLRYLVGQNSTNNPIYFGFKFKPYVKQGYMSGGSGYILSKEAVIRFVESGLADPLKCRPQPNGAEDLLMGSCLEKVNVTAGDSRDTFGRHKFMPIPILQMVNPYAPRGNNWFYKYTFYKVRRGISCCSDFPISFHYVQPQLMYIFDYFIYRFKTYGVFSTFPDELKLNQKVV